MACNCGRKRVIRQDPNVSVNDTDQAASTLVADGQVTEVDTTQNRTDPATGSVRQETAE